MQCYVYKSLKKPDTYLYLRLRNDFRDVPDTLLALFGNPQFVMDFDISQKKTLGREDIEMVKTNLQQQGYHLQMPDAIPDSLSDRDKH